MKRRQGSQPDNQAPQTPPSVDAYFDRELTPDSIESLLSSMRQSRAKRRQFDETQSLLDELRSPVDAPDLSSKVLNELGERRGWLTGGQRRMVIAGRLASAACLLLVVTGLLVLRRDNPQAFRTADATGPVTEIVEASNTEATAGLRAIHDGLRTIELRCQPAVHMAAESVSSCEAAHTRSVRIVASARSQDYTMPLSPGVGSWLSASNVNMVVLVGSHAPQGSGAPQDVTINRWLINPDSDQRYPSYNAASTNTAQLINVADWTAMAGRVK